MGTRLINTADKENIQHIATTPDHYGRNFSQRGRVGWPFTGRSVMSTDGAEWKHSRNLINPTFSRAEMSDIDGLGQYLDRLISLIPEDGQTFDIQPLFQKLFIDISTEFLFGKSMDSLLPDNPFDYEKFYAALERSLTGLMQRRQAGNMRSIRYAYDPEWKQAYKEVHAYIDERVAEALEKTSSSSSPNEAPEGKHRKYVLLQEMAKQIRDPIELRYQIIGVFLPARDTTSTLLSNALFNLARNPHIWHQLRQTTLQLDPEKLTFESLKSLKDFRNVIFETLRLQGPSGRSQTAAKRDTVLPRGGGADGQSPILVKRGTHLSSNVWAMHHDPDLYPSPFVFKPERWAGKRQSWEFVPFLGGPRICPANQQVLTYATYTLVRLTREYAAIENRDPVLQYVELTKMTTRSRNGVKISLIR